MEELKSQHEEFLNKIYSHIEENIDKEGYSVEDLAEHVGLSRSMLHRKLKKLTGKSPGDLITLKRLAKAREMLEKDVGTVSEIAYRVGFNSPSYFNKVFKKHFKVSPGDVKKQPGKYTYPSQKPKTNYMHIPKKLKKYAWMLLIAGNLLLIYIIINSWNAVPFSEKDWIIITDFENLTGDTILNKSLNRALEISLQQSAYVNVYPRSRINEVLERMEMDKSTGVNEEIGIEIAKREGIKLIVVCSISEIGGLYTLGSKIIEVKSGESLRSQTFQANGLDKILNNLDKLGRKIRKDLGESLKTINYETVPLPAATTNSLEALDYFVKAGSAWSNEGKNDEAINLYREALKLDPDFALAHAALGSMYYWINQRQNGEKHFKRALELLERLTEKEKLSIEARIELFRGNYDGAIIKYGVLLKKYPDLNSAWFSLGYSYMMLNQYKNAIDAYQKSIAIFNDEDANVNINIATCYSSMNEYSIAEEYYLKAFEINPAMLKIYNLHQIHG
jgi:AraC-like DNA-binding protein